MIDGFSAEYRSGFARRLCAKYGLDHWRQASKDMILDQFYEDVVEERINPWTVEELRALDYHSEYLKHPWWMCKRKRIYNRARGRCEWCGARCQLNVHHMTYERLGRELDEDLIAVCRPCHDAAHNTDGTVNASMHLVARLALGLIVPEQ